jgi:hypothetical protein
MDHRPTGWREEPGGRRSQPEGEQDREATQDEDRGFSALLARSHPGHGHWDRQPSQNDDEDKKSQEHNLHRDSPV